MSIEYVEFYRGLEENLPAESQREASSIYITEDTGKLYVGNTRIGAPFENGVGENSIQQVGNFAIGVDSIAYGQQSFSVGEASQATGIGTSLMPQIDDKAELLSSWKTTKFNAAIGYNSRVMGKDCIAVGTAAFAQGLNNAAVGNRAVALGNSVIVNGNNSFGVGSEITVSHKGSQAMGKGLTTSRDYQTVIGTHNVDNDEALFIIGKGSTTAPYNAFEVTYAADMGVSLKVGSSTLTESQIQKTFNDTNSAENNGVLPFGFHNYVSGQACVALGDHNEVTGDASGAIGRENILNRGNSFAIGRENNVNALHGFAFGYKNVVTHRMALALGEGLVSSRGNQTIVGSYNVDNSDAIFIVGRGNTSTRANAFAVTHNGAIQLGSASFGTTDLVEGESSLAPGQLYFVYEE